MDKGHTALKKPSYHQGFQNFEKLLQHPTPQRYRDTWWTLNGQWDFDFDPHNIGKKEKWYKGHKFSRKIEVPYSYQSKASGIGEKKEVECVWYQRDLELTIKKNKRYLLHFQASDYTTEVWINGEYIGRNFGGFFEFTFDISSHLTGKDRLTVRVMDHSETHQHLGKQTYKDEPFLCWYTRTTGIWQDVWIEETSKNYIRSFHLTPNLAASTLDIEAFTREDGHYYLETKIYFGNLLISQGRTLFINKTVRQTNYVSTRHADFRVFYWTPETPNLYQIQLSLVDEKGQIVDEVQSYFGMRKFATRDGFVTLNNKKYFHKMILDQGYFLNSLMTATPKALQGDVIKIKEMGFNGVRKHQKIEDMRFMFLCDVYGLILWAEIPSQYEFSKRSIDEMNRNIYRFINRHYNSPCVGAYVLFNESWGLNRVYDSKAVQSFVNGMYYTTKAVDDTRPIIGNDGWEHSLSDILTIHDYNSNPQDIKSTYENREDIVNSAPSRTSNRYNFVPGYTYSGQPIFISEYGGIAFETDSAKGFDSWGYGERQGGPEGVLKSIRDLTQAFAQIPYIAGICYTQLSDVEQEINGLLDHNHEYKFPLEEIRAALDTDREGGYLFK